MPTCIPALLAILWLVLVGASLGHAVATQAVWRGPDWSDAAASPHTVVVEPDAPIGDAPIGYLQLALVQLAEHRLDEAVVAAGEIPVWAGRPLRVSLQGFGVQRPMRVAAAAARRGDRYRDDPGAALLVANRCDFGAGFSTDESSFTGAIEVGTAVAGRVMVALRDVRWHHRGESSLDQELPNHTLRGAALAFGVPRLWLRADTGQWLLLRCSETPVGAGVASRSFWRDAWMAAPTAVADEWRADAATQTALAALLWRDAGLLATARRLAAASVRTATTAPQQDSARPQRRYAALALGEPPAADGPSVGANPFTFERTLAWRALWLQQDVAAAERVAAWMQSELDVNGFGAALLARRSAPAAIAPVWAALQQEALRATTPAWLRGVPALPWLLGALPLLGLVVALARPRRLVPWPPLSRPVLLGLQLALLFLVLPLAAPCFAWLLWRRWAAMAWFWRLVGGVALLLTTSWLLVLHELLPAWPVLRALSAAGPIGVWLSVAAWVAADRSWRAPGLVSAAVGLQLAVILAAGPLAPAAWRLLCLGWELQIAVYLVGPSLLLLVFVLLPRRRAVAPAPGLPPDAGEAPLAQLA